MRRVKSFWRKDTKNNNSNLKYSNSGKGSGGSKNGVFNICLDPNNPIIPNIVIQTIEYIEKYAINENGLFRVFGNQTDVNSLKLAFEKYETIDLSKISNPHIVTSVLKLYLRELPEPLFTFNSYEALIVSYGISDQDTRLAMIKSIVQKIVKHHLVVLDYLFAFLNRVSSKSANGNNMDSSNLAIIFAPTLLKSKSETPEKLIADSPCSTSIIKIIIDNYSEIFEKDPITGEFVSPTNLKPFFEQDYLLASKYETINLDKEIAEIFQEEEEILKNSIDYSNENHNEENNNRLVTSNNSNKPRPSVFQVFGNNQSSLSSSSSLLSPPTGIVSYNGSRLSVISNDSLESSPDVSHDINDEEEEELKKPPGVQVLSNSSSSNRNKYYEGDDDDEGEYNDDDDEDDDDNNNGPSSSSLSNNGNQDYNEIEFKIQVIKELIDKTILELQAEFNQLEKDLQDNLSFQEILLVATSLKSIINILTDGPDVDSQVVSSFELSSSNDGISMNGGGNGNGNGSSSNDSVDPQQIKRLEVLKKAILLKINQSIPSLLLELKEEANTLIQQEDHIGKDICLVDLITIMRTLRSVNDVLDFFFSKWSLIASTSNAIIKKSPLSSPSSQSPILLSTNSKSNIIIKNNNNNNNNNNTSTTTTTTTTTTNPTSQQPQSFEILSQTQQPQVIEEEFTISIQLNPHDIIQNMNDIDMVLYEAEETLMGISSKSELIYIAKIVQNIQKIVRLPVKVSGSFVDDIPLPKINTLKITPKQKLAPLVSVIYVLIKEIRDQISLFRENFEKQFNNTTNNSNNNMNNKNFIKELTFYQQRLLDLWKVLSKLPAFNSYKTSYRNRKEISSNNCQYMRETIESTLKKLEPLFNKLYQDVVGSGNGDNNANNNNNNNNNNITLDNLIIISRSITKIKKLFEDTHSVYQRTSILFSPFQLSKNNSISISSDCFQTTNAASISASANINSNSTSTSSSSSSSSSSSVSLSSSPQSISISASSSLSPTMNDKITTLKSLTGSIIDQVILRLSNIAKHFPLIDTEIYLFEIIDILKSVITNFKDIKQLNI